MVFIAPGFLTFILLQQQKVLIQYQFTFWVGKGIQVPALNVCWSLWQCSAYFSLDQVLCGAALGTDQPCGQYLGKADIIFVSCFLARNKEGVIFNLVLALAKLLSTRFSYLVASLKLSLWCRGALFIGGGATSQGRTVTSVSFMQMRWSFYLAWVSLYSGGVCAWCLVLFSAIVCTCLGPFRCGSVLWASSRTGGLSACQAGISVWLLCSEV